MTTDIRVGDRFMIEVEAVTFDTRHDVWRVRFAGLGVEMDADLPPKTLLASKRLPRAIRVGDRVRPGNPGPCAWTVTAIHGVLAWCHRPDDGDGGCCFPLSDLTLCDEVSS